MQLEELLDKIDGSRLLWVSPERKVTAGELKHDLIACRRVVPCSAMLRVAIEISDSVAALTWMMALDGVADTVFLVPESLQDISAYTELKEQFKPNFIVCETMSEQVMATDSGDYLNGNAPAERKCDTRWVLATSGTTGTPKLIEHTTDGLTKTCKSDAIRGRNYVWGLVYDPFRFAGLQVVLQALAGGSPLVLCNRKSNITTQADFLCQNNVNALSATPTYWRKLLMSGALKGHAFRQVTLGGEPADQPILNALKSAFPSTRVTHVYASTEAGVGFSVTDGLAGFPKDFLDKNVGGNKLRISATSTLLIKPEKHLATSAVDHNSLVNEDGYIDTGDLVEIRGGRVLFLGRDSGSINVGGNKVIPEEVEAVIREVAGVAEVVVKPQKSGIMGQLVIAYIQPLYPNIDKGALKKNIAAHCRECLEKHKVPALIKFVGEIEHNSTGKINRE